GFPGVDGADLSAHRAIATSLCPLARIAVPFLDTAGVPADYSHNLHGNVDRRSDVLGTRPADLDGHGPDLPDTAHSLRPADGVELVSRRTRSGQDADTRRPCSGNHADARTAGCDHDHQPIFG